MKCSKDFIAEDGCFIIIEGVLPEIIGYSAPGPESPGTHLNLTQITLEFRTLNPVNSRG
jgi:hypothetical protein